MACSGRVLRLLEHCRVRQTIELDSVPTVLHVSAKGHGDKLFCGYADGKVTLIKINHYGVEGKKKGVNLLSHFNNFIYILIFFYIHNKKISE